MAKKTKNVHYINNSEFSLAIVEYVSTINEAKKKGHEIPIVPNYIAKSFLQIAENLSHKSNFIRYTYREEMVMDAVENCLKAIENYDINAATRSGKPNAFAYFTQIVWYAFLRRITKEKKQQEIKEKYLSQSGIEAFLATELGADDPSSHVANHFVDTLKDRIDKVKAYDTEIKEFSKKHKQRKKRTITADSDLTEFLE
jgi:DNA-directed RNA polymerase specialized sigma24 family protein